MCSHNLDIIIKSMNRLVSLFKDSLLNLRFVVFLPTKTICYSQIILVLVITSLFRYSVFKVQNVKQSSRLKNLSILLHSTNFI